MTSSYLDCFAPVLSSYLQCFSRCGRRWRGAERSCRRYRRRRDGVLPGSAAAQDSASDDEDRDEQLVVVKVGDINSLLAVPTR